MVDISCQAFSELGDEVKQEFYEDVTAAIGDIQSCVSELQESTDQGAIDRMFRSIHTVKGNCNMVFLKEFVYAIHRLEDLFSAIRSKNIAYHEVYGRFAVQIMNLVELQLRLLIETATADGEVLEKIEKLIHQVQSTKDDQQAITAEKAIAAINDGHFSIALVVLDLDSGHAFSFTNASDMEFFEYLLSRQQSASASGKNPRDPFFNICSLLAHQLNSMLAAKCDEQQLRAAIIFLYLNQSNINNGHGSGNTEALSLQQCIAANGFLNRMAGWSEAAELCIQAVEFHDGKGTPRSLKGSEILPAAQVVSLSFDFAFQIILLPELNYKQALFTAVKAINAKKETHYKEKLIQRFNHLVKTEYLTRRMF